MECAEIYKENNVILSKKYRIKIYSIDFSSFHPFFRGVVSSFQLCRQPFRVRSTHADIPEMRHQHLLPMRGDIEKGYSIQRICFIQRWQSQWMYLTSSYVTLGGRVYCS